jgi:glyoxalase family protein
MEPCPARSPDCTTSRPSPGPPQANVDFYTALMKQRLVKKTVNFDDPGTYHLYYGNQTGAPGTILTFFPFADAGPGRAGPGMASAYAYAVPKGGFDALDGCACGGCRGFRRARGAFRAAGHHAERSRRRTGGAGRDRPRKRRCAGRVPFGDLWERDPGPTARLLTDIFGYEEVGHETVRRRRTAAACGPGDARGAVVDLMRSDAPSIGRQGAGTIHHVAFRAEDDAVQRSGGRSSPRRGLASHR